MDDDPRRMVRRVGARVARRSLLANIAGAVVVFVLNAVLSPDAGGPGNEDFSVSLRVFVVFLAIVIPIALAVGDRFSVRVRAWVDDEREPTPTERAFALSIPARQALLAFAVWLLAAGVFAGLQASFDNPPIEVAQIALSIVMGGFASSFLAFLLVERAMRPVFALALRGAPPDRRATLGTFHRLMLSWSLGSGLPLAGIALSQLARTESERGGPSLLVALAATGLVAGWLTMRVAARSLAEPIGDVRRGMQRVRRGDLTVRVEVNDGGEIGLLQAGFNEMVEGLAERRRIEELFGRHVGVEIARQALARGTELGGEVREASALFVDMVGSTAFANRTPPTEVVATLNAMFAAVADVVGEAGGVINKFEGDGALCIFGAPVDQPDHAAAALRAARELAGRLRRLAASHPALDAAIGVSSGTVVAGNVGAPDRFEYTVIGDPVNEAARLTEVAKGRPSRVLASEAAVEAAGDEASRWKPAATFDLRGRAAPTQAFEPGCT